jgi:mannose-1-phosphate guanylyltransferase
VKIVVTIMAGGAGTRFWPLSTEERPKQFLSLVGKRSLLQMSFDRVRDLVPPEQVMVLTNESYEDLVAAQLPEIPRANIIGEPSRKDTAAAVALAALMTRHRFGDSIMVLLTADHVISPVENFQAALLEAAEGCQQGGLYTLGIRPTYPATGFGYLQMGQTLPGGSLPHYQVDRFKEKPTQEVAEVFLESGIYYWNSGMFVWTTEQILREFALNLPAHIDILQPALAGMGTPLGRLELMAAFDQLERISVDYAILEKATDVRAVIPDITWDDVGGWRAVAQYLSLDGFGNRLHGSVWSEEANHNVVFSEDPEEKVLLLGVEDLVVVRSGLRTLVAHRDRLDSLKLAVDHLTREKV